MPGELPSPASRNRMRAGLLRKQLPGAEWPRKKYASVTRIQKHKHVMAPDDNLFEQVPNDTERDAVKPVGHTRSTARKQVASAFISHAVPTVGEQETRLWKTLKPLRKVPLEKERQVLVRHLLVAKNHDLIEEFLVTQIFDQPPYVFGGRLQFPLCQWEVGIPRHSGDEGETAAHSLISQADGVECFLSQRPFVGKVDEEPLIAFRHRRPDALCRQRCTGHHRQDEQQRSAVPVRLSHARAPFARKSRSGRKAKQMR